MMLKMFVVSAFKRDLKGASFWKGLIKP